MRLRTTKSGWRSFTSFRMTARVENLYVGTSPSRRLVLRQQKPISAYSRPFAVRSSPSRHCEERSDAAISARSTEPPTRLRRTDKLPLPAYRKSFPSFPLFSSPRPPRLRSDSSLLIPHPPIRTNQRPSAAKSFFLPHRVHPVNPVKNSFFPSFLICNCPF